MPHTCHSPLGGPGHEHWHRRRDESRMEACRGRARNGAAVAVGQLRSRASSRRRQRVEVDRRVQPTGARPIGDPPCVASRRDPGALRFFRHRASCWPDASAASASPIRHKRDDDRMVGRRMPDIECDGKRLYERLREGKFVLVTAVPVEMDRPDIVHARSIKHPELPDAVLVRPDGYVAWASGPDAERHELSAAIDRWTPRGVAAAGLRTGPERRGRRGRSRRRGSARSARSTKRLRLGRPQATPSAR